jgi:hypothetical protein
MGGMPWGGTVFLGRTFFAFVCGLALPGAFFFTGVFTLAMGDLLFG